VEVPEGYRVEYGGQFENLQQARTRLLIAVPIALLLIFVLLYFAFSSAKDAFMIFTAIPLSAIGGIVLLWMRDMPFSISAGVGFIALFGIARNLGDCLSRHIPWRCGCLAQGLYCSGRMLQVHIVTLHAKAIQPQSCGILQQILSKEGRDTPVTSPTSAIKSSSSLSS
jgi:hypothetical protein